MHGCDFTKKCSITTDAAKIHEVDFAAPRVRTPLAWSGSELDRVRPRERARQGGKPGVQRGAERGSWHDPHAVMVQRIADVELCAPRILVAQPRNMSAAIGKADVENSRGRIT